MAHLPFYLFSFQVNELVPCHLQKFTNYLGFESIAVLTLIKAQIVPCRSSFWLSSFVLLVRVVFDMLCAFLLCPGIGDQIGNQPLLQEALGSWDSSLDLLMVLVWSHFSELSIEGENMDIWYVGSSYCGGRILHGSSMLLKVVRAKVLTILVLDSTLKDICRANGLER